MTGAVHALAPDRRRRLVDEAHTARIAAESRRRRRNRRIVRSAAFAGLCHSTPPQAA